MKGTIYMMTQIQHIPVLLQEVIDHLQPEPNKRFIDGTVGQGGHADAIMSRVLPGGRLLAIDRDPANLAIAKDHLKPFGDAVVFIHDSYAFMDEHAAANGFVPVNGILLDLGYSSLHIEDASRGFSFQKDGPLDMRYDLSQDFTAREIVNTWSVEELARIFRVYGEEEKARDIANAIVDARRTKRIETTLELALLVSSHVRGGKGTNPATKVFQALRIVVNNELDELEDALPRCVDLLAPGGRLAIISFHSLEDRIIKNFFKETPSLHTITKRPITPSREEIKANPRSRSAKLRVAEKK